MQQHQKFMRRCLDLAEKAKGYTHPNPMVGAVLVFDGRIMAEGWHRQYGGDHAEVDCLNRMPLSLHYKVSDCTLYVNLEPCVHHGHTPPCVDRIIKEGIKKVVIANKDPFEKVSGRGIAMLEAAGVEVVTGVLEEEGRWVNRRFFTAQYLKRPYIILKWAQTRNGFIAPSDGTRFHITNPQSARLLHKWRTEEPAILVGTRTALLDDPLLTSRYWPGKQPLRIILDRNLKVQQQHKVFNEDAATWIVNGIKDEQAGNVSYVKMDFHNSLLQPLMTRLYDAGIVSVIVEGGAQILQSFIADGLWDEARIFTGDTVLQHGLPAPLIAGGDLVHTSKIGNDALHCYLSHQSTFTYPADRAF